MAAPAPQESAKEVKKVQVAIQWCGGWGYASKFKAAKVKKWNLRFNTYNLYISIYIYIYICCC